MSTRLGQSISRRGGGAFFPESPHAGRSAETGITIPRDAGVHDMRNAFLGAVDELMRVPPASLPVLRRGIGNFRSIESIRTLELNQGSCSESRRGDQWGGNRVASETPQRRSLRAWQARTVEHCCGSWDFECCRFGRDVASPASAE
jgi:hypothetical protein